MLRLVPILLIFLVISCKNQSQGDPPRETTKIKIGFIGPQTGPFSSWFDHVKNGFEIGMRDALKNYEIIYEDEACNPQKAVTAGKKLIYIDKVKLIFGPGCLSSIKALAPIAQQENILLISFGGIDEDAVKRFDNLIGITAAAEIEAKYLAPYVASLKKFENIAIMHGSNAFGEALGAGVQREFQKVGIEVIAKEFADLNATEMKPYVQRIINQNPDTIFLHQSEHNKATFLKNLRELGYNKKIFAAYSVESKLIEEMARAAINNVAYAYPQNATTQVEEQKQFKQLYLHKYNLEANTTAMIMYDGAKLFVKATKKCPKLAQKCIINFFKSNSPNIGIAGEYTLASNRQAIRPFGIKEYQMGKATWITENLPYPN